MLRPMGQNPSDSDTGVSSTDDSCGFFEQQVCWEIQPLDRIEFSVVLAPEPLHTTSDIMYRDQARAFKRLLL